MVEWEGRKRKHSSASPKKLSKVVPNLTTEAVKVIQTINYLIKNLLAFHLFSSSWNLCYMKILGLNCQALSYLGELARRLLVHTTYADLGSTIFCKYSLTPSCQLSTFLSFAFKEGGILIFIWAVQDSALSVLNPDLYKFGLPLGFGIFVTLCKLTKQ